MKVRVMACVTFKVDVEVELDDADTLDSARGLCVKEANRFVEARLEGTPVGEMGKPPKASIAQPPRAHLTNFVAEWVDNAD